MQIVFNGQKPIKVKHAHYNSPIPYSGIITEFKK